MTDTAHRTSLYILGHTPAEIDRLRDQAARIAPLTHHFLIKAGLVPGMRVLDLGCGLGDVSLLAADLVGPDGLVIGVDRSPDALAIASERAAAARHAHLQFVTGDVETLDTLAADITVDAVIGRYILGHVGDAVAVLRIAARRLGPGGLIAVQEPDVIMTELTINHAPLPLHQQVHGWIERGNAAAGKRVPRASLTLHNTFRQAGLPAPRVEAVTQVDCGVDAWLPAYFAQLIRSLLPVYERVGALTAAEADVDTLEERLRAEIAAVDPEAVLAMWSVVGAWVRLPIAAA